MARMTIKKDTSGVYKITDNKHGKNGHAYHLTYNEKVTLCEILRNLVETGAFDYDWDGEFAASNRTADFIDTFGVDDADQFVVDIITPACLEKVEDYRTSCGWDDSEWGFVVAFTNGVRYVKYGICRDGSAIIDIHVAK